MSGFLLATDYSIDALDAVSLFAHFIELGGVDRIHVVALAWPVDFCEPVPPIGESELEHLDRILHVLTKGRALIQAERASGTSARDVLAAAATVDASMIVLALSAQDRTNELITKLIDNSWLPLIRLPSRCSASQGR